MINPECPFSMRLSKRFKSLVPVYSYVCEPYSGITSAPVVKYKTKRQIEFANNVYASLNALDPLAKEMLINSFLDDRKLAQYKSRFSSSTYYRLRNEALTSFFESYDRVEI